MVPVLGRCTVLEVTVVNKAVIKCIHYQSVISKKESIVVENEYTQYPSFIYYIFKLRVTSAFNFMWCLCL